MQSNESKTNGAATAAPVVIAVDDQGDEDVVIVDRSARTAASASASASPQPSEAAHAAGGAAAQEEVDVCPITLTPFTELAPDDVLFLPCFHRFEKNAIMRHLSRVGPFCPVCRLYVNPALVRGDAKRPVNGRHQRELIEIPDSDSDSDSDSNNHGDGGRSIRRRQRARLPPGVEEDGHTVRAMVFDQDTTGQISTNTDGDSTGSETIGDDDSDDDDDQDGDDSAGSLEDFIVPDDDDLDPDADYVPSSSGEED
jgi:hypothetical protein